MTSHGVLCDVFAGRLLFRISRAWGCTNSWRPVAEIGPVLQTAEPDVMVGSCGLLPWRCAGFRDLSAQEGFDDTHRTAAFRARLKPVLFVSAGERVFLSHLIRLWLTVQQAPDIADPVAPDAICEEACVSDGVLSPLLANLFLHYAFDMWMNRNFHL